MKKILFVGFLFLTLTSSFAQLEMGGWRTHLSYNKIEQICASENKIFAVSEGSLFSVDKRDGNMEFYSKISGLNGTVVNKIAYDKKNDILVIVYKDGNIDFVNSGGIQNLPDFYNKQIAAKKITNDILIHKETAYLSTSFGIITLNIKKQEIQDTYYIGENASNVEVLNTTILKDKIYAVSKKNIYFADVNNPQIINYQNWEKVENLPNSGDIKSFQAFADKGILLRKNKLFIYDNGTWTPLDASLSVENIRVSNSYLFIFTKSKAFYYKDNLTNRVEVKNLSSLVDGIVENKSKSLWFCGDARGLARYKNEQTEFFKPNGPAVNMPYRMKFAGEKLFVIPNRKYARLENVAGDIMIFEDNTWKNIYSTTIQEKVGNKVVDFSSIAVDKKDNKHFYITSANSGIYEFKDDKFYQHFDRSNSNIKTAADLAGYIYQWVDNAVLDKKNNLWFTNDLTSEGIKVYLANSEWVGLKYDGVKAKQNLGTILINSQNENQKWVLSRTYSYRGICIFDDNGTIKDKSDDKSVFYPALKYSINSEEKEIVPKYFFCIEQDKEGDIWIGTSDGPFVIRNTATDIFNNKMKFSRITIPRNDGTNIVDFLLEKESIKAIAIDGANRKWIGTENSGLYLLSEDGKTTIHHFTTKNSPLTSNDILSLDINPITGEVFIGTGAGLISYQSDSALAEESFENLHIYPNPVRENYNGLITIAGLMENSFVKITDISGNLVAELKSNGSLATWDGKNKYGQKVSTGVYLAICTSSDNTETKTKKILIIN